MRQCWYIRIFIYQTLKHYNKNRVFKCIKHDYTIPIF